MVTKVMLPVPPFCEKVMVSPVTGATKPVRVAVHVELAPMPKVVGEHETVVTVVAFVQVTPWELELPEWSVSPGYVAVMVTVPSKPELGV